MLENIFKYHSISQSNKTSLLHSSLKKTKPSKFKFDLFINIKLTPAKPPLHNVVSADGGQTIIQLDVLEFTLLPIKSGTSTSLNPSLFKKAMLKVKDDLKCT